MFYTPDLLRLIATIFIAVTCVVIGDTAGKLLTGGGVDPFIVAWSRFFLAALMLLPFSRLTPRELPALLNRSVLLRAVFIVCGICCILTALKTEPIANVFGGIAKLLCREAPATGSRMKTPSSMPRLKGFRFPREIIAYAVWAYHRFALSGADVEDLLAERGVIVSRESIRLWVNRFGAQFATCIRRDRPGPSDKWHLDEVVIPIRGRKHWLWRAVDANGHTLDILVQTRRNARAARRFLARLIAQFGQPRVMITDKLRSYFKPIRNLAPDADHRAHKGLNNLVEGSHRPTRRREKIMGRFKSQRQAQRFLAAHDQINTLFRPRRYRLTASSYRHARADAFSLWNDYALEMNA